MDVEQLVREYIDKTVHMSLATVRGAKPWVCEVHFAYDKELNLYYRSLKSRRHSQEIAVNPYVAGDIIDKYAVGDAVVGLYFEGKAELLKAGEIRRKASECLQARLQITDDILAEAERESGHQFYRITVSNFSIFGKFERENSKKHQLAWKCQG